MPDMTITRACNLLGWKRNPISSMTFQESEENYAGTWYRDFHRADLLKSYGAWYSITCNSCV